MVSPAVTALATHHDPMPNDTRNPIRNIQRATLLTAFTQPYLTYRRRRLHNEEEENSSQRVLLKRYSLKATPFPHGTVP